MSRLAEALGERSGGSSAPTSRATAPASTPTFQPVAPAPQPVAVVEPVAVVAPAPAPVPVFEPAPVAVVAPAPAPTSALSASERYTRLVQESLALSGVSGAAVFDVATGSLLAGSHKDPSFDLARAAAGSAEMVRAKLQTMKSLGLDEGMEDLVASFGAGLHLLGSMASDNSVFGFLDITDKSQAAIVRMRFTKLRDHTA